jgi:hypothetical protein
MVALRRARPYGSLSQVRPYRGLRRVRPYGGLRPRLACGSWIARFQQTRIVITPRLQLIMEKGADKRRENLPMADEIALLIPGEKDRPSNRKVIFIARSARDAPN